MIHRLKCWVSSFDAIASGRKRCEIRRTDDRTFAIGDELILIRWDPGACVSLSPPEWTFGKPTGKWAQARVTWVDVMAGPLVVAGAQPGCETFPSRPLAVLSIDLLQIGAGEPPSE